jgi:hypothetical protein
MASVETRTDKLGRSYAAVRARSTHCKRDHEFTIENTRLDAAGNRKGCIACDRARQRADRQRGYWVEIGRKKREQRALDEQWYDWVAVHRALTGHRVGRRLTEVEVKDLLHHSQDMELTVLAALAHVGFQTAKNWRAKYGRAGEPVSPGPRTSLLLRRPGA